MLSDDAIFDEFETMYSAPSFSNLVAAQCCVSRQVFTTTLTLPAANIISAPLSFGSKDFNVNSQLVTDGRGQLQ